MARTMIWLGGHAWVPSDCLRLVCLTSAHPARQRETPSLNHAIKQTAPDAHHVVMQVDGGVAVPGYQPDDVADFRQGIV